MERGNYCVLFHTMLQNTQVSGMLIGYSDEATGWMVRGSHIDSGKMFFSLLHIVQTGFSAYPVFAGKASGA